MIWFALRKLLGLVVTLVVAATLLFFLLELTPGGATDPPGSFATWVGQVLVGDLGMSVSRDASVGSVISGGLAVTLPLALSAMLLTVALGAGAGILAARRPNGRLDRSLMAFGRFGAAVPEFWLGMLLALVISGMLHLLPSGGFVQWSDNPLGAMVSLLLPTVAVGLPHSPAVARAVRDGLAGLAGSALIEAARARGVTTEEAIRRHGLRNAALPVLASLRFILPSVFVATLAVETVFYLPGLGRMLFDAAGARDVALVRGGLVILLVLLAGTRFLVDLMRGAADPRLQGWGNA